MQKRTIDMTTGSPAKHILRFAFPLLLTNIGQQLYMIADGAIVGRGVGVTALAAVGATDWSYWLILWTVGGLAQGFSTFVSRAFGEKNYPEMNKIIAASITLCAMIGGLLTVLGLVAARPLMQYLNTPVDILPGAIAYLTTMVSGTLIVMGYNMAAAILRSLGNGRSPLVAMIIAAILNIGLDCLFVFVFQWGILGAAAASLISQGVSFVYCVIAISKIETIRLDRQSWQFGKKRLFRMLVYGLPIAMQYVVITLGGIILQSGVNLQGSFFIAGYTATNKLYGLLQCFAMSFSLSAATFVAQNYGARLFNRVKRGVVVAVKIVTIAAVIIMALTLLTRWQILRVFLNENQPGGEEALATAVRYLVIMVLCFPILHILHVFRDTLLSIGVSVWPMLSGFAEFGARVLMVKLLLERIGPDTLFLAEPASWLGAMLCVFLPYFHYTKKMVEKEN
jgi:putative MATE family efflux protein